MTSFIEELYYDNIKPQEKSIRKSDLCKEELSVLHENEQFLLENIPDDLKTVFIEYVDTWGIKRTCYDRKKGNINSTINRYRHLAGHNNNSGGGIGRESVGRNDRISDSETRIWNGSD